MIKLLVIIVLGLLWSGSVYAETIVFHKCWEPRIKNAYGDKVKSFKEFSKYLNKSRDFKDYIIKIDTDKSSILSRFILSNGFDPIDPKTEYSNYVIVENRGTFIIGKKVYHPNKGRMIAIDLEKKQAGYWVGNIKNFKKFYTSCKLYKGGSSILESILKRKF
jgi:hypothetical protein